MAASGAGRWPAVELRERTREDFGAGSTVACGACDGARKAVSLAPASAGRYF